MPKPIPGICMKCGAEKGIGKRCIPCWREYLAKPEVIQQRRDAVKRYESTPAGKESKKRRIRRTQAKKQTRARKRQRTADLRALRVESMRACLVKILGCFEVDPYGGKTINQEKLGDLMGHLRLAEDLIKLVPGPTLKNIRQYIKLMETDLQTVAADDKVATYHGLDEEDL